MPMEGFGLNLGVLNFGPVLTEDRPDPSGTPPMRSFKYASPGFFRTAGTRLVAGREMTWTEVHGLRPVVMISENLARELWGTPAAAIGKHLRHVPDVPWHEVIGVVQDVRENGVYQPAPPTVYWPSISAYVIAIGSAAECHSPGHLHRPQRARWHGRFSEPGPASRVVGELQPARVAADDARGLRSVSRARRPSRW